MAELDPSRHLTEEELVWHYYGEENVVDVQSHLDLCRKCSSDYQALKSSMASIDTLAAPNPAAGYENQLWSALVKRDPSITSRASWWSRLRRMRSPMYLAWASGVAALVFAAFLAGRLSTQAPRTVDSAAASPAAASPEAVRERLLIGALSEHLEQSERILLEIDNRELRNERQRAEDLLSANRLYRQTAGLAGKSSLEATLEDLERVLLDVAHSPDRPTPAQLRELQARIQDQGLLFKVQTLGSRLRQLDQLPVPRPSGPAPQSLKSMKG